MGKSFDECEGHVRSKSTTIHRIHQNFPLSNFCTIGYTMEHLTCLKTQECKIYISQLIEKTCGTLIIFNTL